jgi:hypothetical protein
MLDTYKSEYNNGFHITFKNGLTISVQFGKGNYCTPSRSAEIAIWDNDNQDYNFGNDMVKGWLSPEEIAAWIYAVSTATNLTTIKAPLDNE